MDSSIESTAKQMATAMHNVYVATYKEPMSSDLVKDIIDVFSKQLKTISGERNVR